MDSSHLKPLNFLIGHWRTDGEVTETSKSPRVKIQGTDTYEWILGGTFIFHRANVMMGDVQTEVIELIGEFDESRYTYQMRSFDNTGIFTTMQASVDGNGVLVITGDNMKSKLSAAKDGNIMKAHWEMSEDGKTWMPWMDLTFTKL